MSPEEDLLNRYVAAAAALERGDALSARREFELITLQAPRFAPAWDGLGSCYEAEGELKRAGDHYRRAMRLDRRGWRARYNWGLALHRAGELEEAARWLRQAAKLAPEERRIQRWLGQVLFDMGDAEEAVRVYRRALEQPEREVRDAELHTLIGRAEAEQGNYEVAEKAYELACLLSPDEAAVYHHWAVLTALRGDPEAADRLAARAAALEPRSLPYRLLRVKLAAEAGNPSAAEARIAELAQLPGHQRLQTALRAELARGLGDAREAEQLAIEALVSEGPLSDQATDLALTTLRELRGLRIQCRGYRLLAQVRCGDSSYFRPFVVLAPGEALAREMAGELQERLDSHPWEIIEVEYFPHDQEALAGVYQVLLTRVLFPNEDSPFPVARRD